MVLHGIVLLASARAVSRKTPTYFIISTLLQRPPSTQYLLQKHVTKTLLCFPIQLQMPFHIFIQTIFKLQLPNKSKCLYVITQCSARNSWVVVTIEMSQTISHFHFTASHVVSDSLWFNCVKQFLNCSTSVLSLQRDTSERDINFKSVCLKLCHIIL